MPYRDKANKTAYQRDYMRRKRAGSNSKGLTGSNKGLTKQGLTYSAGSNKAQGLTGVIPTAAQAVTSKSRVFRSFSKMAQVGKA